MSSSTLDSFLEKMGPVINFETVCAITVDVIRAIEQLEHLGICHNNITTRNILITSCQGVSVDLLFKSYSKHGPVIGNMVSANHWLSSTRLCQIFSWLCWYLTLVSANQASSNSALQRCCKSCKWNHEPQNVFWSRKR